MTVTIRVSTHGVTADKRVNVTVRLRSGRRAQ
jgi:hypothetical protein